jgi:internalin A
MWLQRQEVECRRMNPAEPARLDLKDLDALLAQAKAERWTKLALLAGILAEHFAATIRSGWPAAQVVILSTPLQQVPEALSHIDGLTSLDLMGNQIGDAGAEALARLSGLTSLDLRANEIGDAGAEALSRLGGLTLLQLGANRIGDGGAEALSRLGGLTELDLWGNQIGIPGARAILNAWADPPTSDKRQRLSLGENASTTGLLPAEVLKQTDAQALIAAWRSFREAEAAGTLRPLNEAKLLVVGNEAVGKTSLVRYLIDNRPRDPDEKKTPGVAMRERIATETWAPRGGDVRLNVWDFGGQEIMRGTHRYFLTKRSLYLLVLEDRREDDRSVYDWLKIIKSRGEESPVLVVINKCDEGEPKLRLDVTALRRDYPAVVEVVAVSCNAGSDERIAGLRALIARTIADDARLRHVRDPFPAEQLRVKEAVAAAARNASVLEHRAFVRLCEEVDDPALRVLDPNLQRSLLQLLHDLGTVVAHGLERNLAALREVTLLDPNWLTDAIYALLNSRQILDQGGEFGFTDMAALLDPARFPPERFEYIVEMMQEEEIGLCFRLPGGGEPRWLMPEALPTSAPDYGGLFKDALRFRFTYAVLPPGLLPRFIVQAHDKLTNEPTRWRTGVVLAAADCKVLVRADRDRERVDIAVTGPVARRRSALQVVLEDLAVVHKLNPEIGTEARVPLPDDPEVDVSHAHLLELEADEPEGAAYSYRPEKAKRKYTVGELLAGVRGDGAVRASPEPVIVPRLPVPPPSLAAHPYFPLFCGVAAMAVVVLLFILPTNEWRAIVLGVLGAGVLVMLLATHFAPGRFYRRSLSWALAGGMFIHAAGFSIEAGFFGDAGARFQWSGQVSVGFSIAWMVIVVALIRADNRQTAPLHSG